MIEPEFRYQQGGSLDSNALTYVERDADAELFAALKAGKFCYVLNSRQMGKSSLAVRAGSRLKAIGHRCVYLDLSRLQSGIGMDAWYKNLAYGLMKGLKLRERKRWKSWWKEVDFLSPMSRLSELIETLVLPNLSQPLTVFIDEIDSVLGLEFQTDDVFAFIRACYNQRPVNRDYERLTFCLLGVASPAELIRDPNRTPFNLGQAIRLRGMDFDRARKVLTKGLSGLSDPEAGLREILDWTGGQPFLTQKACRLVAEAAQGDPEVDVSGVVRSAIVENWNANDDPIHLRHIAEKIVNSDRAGRLLALYGRVWQDEASPETAQVVDVESKKDERALLLSGIAVRDDEGQLRVYNCVYREVFDLEWIAQKQAKLRPYQDKFDRWQEALAESCEFDKQKSSWSLKQNLPTLRKLLLKGKRQTARDFFLSPIQQIQGNLGSWSKRRKLNDKVQESLLQAKPLREARKWSQGKRLADEDYDFLAASQERWMSKIRNRSLAVAFMAVLIAFIASIWTLEALRKAEASEKQVKVARQRLEEETIRFQNEQQAMDARTAYVLGRMEDFNFDELQLLYAANFNVRQALLRRGKGSNYSAVSLALSTAKELYDVWGVRTGRSSSYPLKSRTIYGLHTTLEGTEKNTLVGHTGYVRSARFSGDGSQIVSASSDGTIKIWDMTTGRVHSLIGHSDWVNSVAISRNRSQIASASSDGTIKIWDTETGELSFNLSGHSKKVLSVRFSPDGSQIVSASSDGTVKLWSTTTGKELRTLKSYFWYFDRINAASFSRDGSQIVSASSDGHIKLWDVATGRELRNLSGHANSVNSVNFSPDGSQVVSAYADGYIKSWNPETGEEVSALTGHTDSVHSVSFNPNGSQIVSASSDGTVKLWNAKTGEELRSFNGHSDGVLSANFSPDGRQIVSASDDKTVKVWDVFAVEEHLSLNSHSQKVNDANFSRDGRQVVSASDDGTVKLWDTETGNELHSLEGHRREVRSNGRVWPGRVVSASFSPDGSQVVSASSNGIVRVWDALLGSETHAIEGHSAGISSADFSPDGSQIASASPRGGLDLWNVETGNKRRQNLPEGHYFGFNSVSFSSDGSDGERIAAASSDSYQVHVWDATTGEKILTLTGHSDRVNSLNFSADGSKVVSASSDGTVKLWNAVTGAELRSLYGHSGQVNDANFSEDGSKVVSASSDGTVKLWNAATGEEFRSLSGHYAGVNSANFSPDGRQVVSASDDGTVKIWKVETFEALIDRACDTLTPWLQNPNSPATDEDRALCDLPLRETP